MFVNLTAGKNALAIAAIQHGIARAIIAGRILVRVDKQRGYRDNGNNARRKIALRAAVEAEEMLALAITLVKSDLS